MPSDRSMPSNRWRQDRVGVRSREWRSRRARSSSRLPQGRRLDRESEPRLQPSGASCRPTSSVSWRSLTSAADIISNLTGKANPGSWRHAAPRAQTDRRTTGGAGPMHTSSPWPSARLPQRFAFVPPTLPTPPLVKKPGWQLWPRHPNRSSRSRRPLARVRSTCAGCARWEPSGSRRTVLSPAPIPRPGRRRFYAGLNPDRSRSAHSARRVRFQCAAAVRGPRRLRPRPPLLLSPVRTALGCLSPRPRRVGPARAVASGSL